MAVFSAHSPNSFGEQHDFEYHLRQVGELAARFASALGSAEWGRLAGLWHDLGKYRGEFRWRLEA